jgi:hypothetical protein
MNSSQKKRKKEKKRKKSILQASNSKSQNNSVASRLPTIFLGAQLYKYIPHIISREREMR